MSKIEWTDETWNPITGCTPISEGCKNCYAKRMANRLRGRCGYLEDEPFKVTIHEDKMNVPFSWKKPRKCFVCSMGDLFHEHVNIRGAELQYIFHVMVTEYDSTFILLTKRPERMKKAIEHLNFVEVPQNLWLGVTAENQRTADERIPILLQIPAAVRFVSVEPMLGPVDVSAWLYHKRAVIQGDNYPVLINDAPILDWIICGGETGPGARPMHPDWAKGLRDQCRQAGTPFFFKKHGDWFPIYGTGRTNGDEEDEHTPFTWISLDGKQSDSGCHPDALMLKSYAKANAGRLLDGEMWEQYPETPSRTLSTPKTGKASEMKTGVDVLDGKISVDKS